MKFVKAIGLLSVPVFCILTLIGCKNTNGKIEKRFASYYLVNKSFSKKYQFTVKKTEVQDKKLYKFSTELFELAPGDEKLLGVQSFRTVLEYPIVYRKELVTHEILSKEEIERYKKDPLLSAIPEIILDHRFFPDTTINGKKLKYEYVTKKYIDNLHPLPIKYFEYEFEIAGEIEMK